MNYVTLFGDIKTFWNSLSKTEKNMHAALWLIATVIINIPALELRMGAFYGGDFSLQLATLYGLPINAAIFYGISASLQHFQQKKWRTILIKQGGFFLVLCLAEVVLDTVLFFGFYETLSQQWVLEIVIGSFLLNFMFIVIPAWVFGIIKAGLNPQKTETTSKLSIKDGAKEIMLEKEELFYVKSEGNYVLYQTARGKFMVRASLKSIEEELPDEFIRCHKSYIINKSIIERKTYSECMIAEFSIPIGRTYRNRI